MAAIRGQLNNGFLPPSNNALTENQRDGRKPGFVDLGEPDTSHESNESPVNMRLASELPPSTSYHDVSGHPEYADKVITVRTNRFNEVVAAIRIVTPYTKRSSYKLNQFIGWTVEVIRDGISVLIIDLF